MSDYVMTLASTILLELLVWIVACRGGTRGQRGYVALLIVALNLTTHPLATLAVSFGGGWWLIEGAVVVTEASLLGLLTPWTWPRAAFLTAAMNGVSALAGVGAL